MKLHHFNDYLIHNLAKRFFNKFNISYFFNPIEKSYEDRLLENNTCNSNPVFIIGLPRSGTTLLYQLLLNRYYFSYFSVFVTFFPCTPLLAFRFQKILSSKSFTLGYTSVYGRIQNKNFLNSLFSPSEGHPVFQKFFNNEFHHEHIQPLSNTNSIALRNLINGFSIISSYPFINKNPRNSLRIIPLATTFPDASFIVIQRDLFYVAQSLHFARQQTPQDIRKQHNTWWGTRFKEYKNYSNLSSLEQSAYQARILNQKLYTHLPYIKNLHIVDYSYMCNYPQKTLDDIEAFLAHNNIHIKASADDELPSLKSGDTQRISDTDANVIHKILMDSY